MGRLLPPFCSSPPPAPAQLPALRVNNLLLPELSAGSAAAALVVLWRGAAALGAVPRLTGMQPDSPRRHLRCVNISGASGQASGSLATWLSSGWEGGWEGGREGGSEVEEREQDAR